MEIYFDHKALKLLRYIKWHKSSTISDIQNKFGDDANSNSLKNLCFAGYLVAIKENGKYSTLPDNEIVESTETLWVTPKGRKILDDRFDRLWQWLIPTSISVLALIFSIITFIVTSSSDGIIRVLLQ